MVAKKKAPPKKAAKAPTKKAPPPKNSSRSISFLTLMGEYGRSLNRSDFEAYLLAQRCGCTGHIRHVDVHFIPASCM